MITQIRIIETPITQMTWTRVKPKLKLKDQPKGETTKNFQKDQPQSAGCQKLSEST
jgi:hypothetical protein